MSCLQERNLVTRRRVCPSPVRLSVTR